MPTAIPLTRDALRQTIRQLGEAVRVLEAKTDSEITGVDSAELRALNARVEQWTNEIMASSQQIRHSDVPLSLAGDPHVYHDAIDVYARISPETRQQADVRIREAQERGRSYRDLIHEEIGPLFSASDVAARLGISRVTVNNWRRQNRLLALQWDSHQYRYPAFQFAASPAEGEHVGRGKTVRDFWHDGKWANPPVSLRNPHLGGGWPKERVCQRSAFVTMPG